MPTITTAVRLPFVQVLPETGQPLTEGGMCFISVMRPGRPGAPRAVSVSTHTEAASWWGLAQESYTQQKQGYMERLLDACERAFPGFREGLRFAQAATPRTFAHYTLRGGGVVGGLRQTRWRAAWVGLASDGGAGAVPVRRYGVPRPRHHRRDPERDQCVALRTACAWRAVTTWITGAHRQSRCATRWHGRGSPITHGGRLVVRPSAVKTTHVLTTRRQLSWQTPI